MRILVVCGAGASSTFVAQRVRHAAHDQGLAYSAFAGTELSLPIDLDAADVVLVGPHLSHALERIERDAAHRGTTVVLLPPDIFTDLDGTRTLALVRAAVGSSGGNLPTAGTVPQRHAVDAAASSDDAEVNDS
jgi:PTS system cellobiose-specific IIB component